MKPLHWTKAVVRRLTSNIQAGAKFFVGHGVSNSHDGRTEVGEVLTSFVKEIKGKLSSIVVGWFPEKESVATMDVCSIEANVEVDDYNGYVNDVNEVSAIALGNSSVDSPAFPGAMRLASVQCFEGDENKPKSNPGEGDEVTFRDVQDFIKERNVFVHQLYNEQDLKDDREFGSLFTAVAEKDKQIADLEKQIADQKTAVADSEKKAKVATAKDRFDGLVPDDLTAKQKAFIASRFDASTIAELSDDEVKKYIENERKEFAETAKLFGVTESDQSGNGGDSDSGDDTGDEGDSSPEEAALKLVGAR